MRELCMFASDFMDTQFHLLHPQQNIAEAVSAFQCINTHL